MPRSTRTRSFLLALAACAASGSALAQGDIVSRLSGDDIVIEGSGSSGTCAGDLYRAELDDLFNGAGPPGTLVAAGMTCPYTIVGDGALRGAETGLFYYVRDPITLQTSSMAFRLERHFDPLYLLSGAPAANTYLVSLPLVQSQNDLANTAAPEANKCVGDADGPAAPDGLLNADDLICQWWTSRSGGQGSMMISFRDHSSASWRDRTGFVDPATGLVTFSGPYVDALTRDDGLMVTVDGPPGAQNRFVITGAHDPLYPGRVISGAVDTQYVLNTAYHCMYSHLDETLCGLDGLDWVDGNNDGAPDMCWSSGLFDGDHSLAAVAYDSILDGGPTDGLYISRNVTLSLRNLRFAGFDWHVRPGDSVLLMTTPDQHPVTYIVPHF